MILSSITQTWTCRDPDCKTPPVVREEVGEPIHGAPETWCYCSTRCAIRMLRFWESCRVFERKEERAAKQREKASASR